MEDAEYIVEAVYEVLDKSKNALKLHLENGKLKDKFIEVKQFGTDLFHETIRHKKEHQQEIEPKLKEGKNIVLVKKNENAKGNNNRDEDNDSKADSNRVKIGNNANSKNVIF